MSENIRGNSFTHESGFLKDIFWKVVVQNKEKEGTYLEKVDIIFLG